MAIGSCGYNAILQNHSTFTGNPRQLAVTVGVEVVVADNNEGLFSKQTISRRESGINTGFFAGEGKWDAQQCTCFSLLGM